MSKTRDVLPIGSTTFLRLQQSSDDQSRHAFFVFVFMFFKPAGDPSSATLVPDLANQVWPFKSALFNPLSATWRIYPSSKWSSQWPYDGYIRHGWMTSCGRGRDSATLECFGRGYRGTIFVRSSKLERFCIPFYGIFENGIFIRPG